jgi:hypothetical protein
MEHDIKIIEENHMNKKKEVGKIMKRRKNEREKEKEKE